MGEPGRGNVLGATLSYIRTSSTAVDGRAGERGALARAIHADTRVVRAPRSTARARHATRVRRSRDSPFTCPRCSQEKKWYLFRGKRDGNLRCTGCDNSTRRRRARERSQGLHAPAATAATSAGNVHGAGGTTLPTAPERLRDAGVEGARAGAPTRGADGSAQPLEREGIDSESSRQAAHAAHAAEHTTEPATPAAKRPRMDPVASAARGVISTAPESKHSILWAQVAVEYFAIGRSGLRSRGSDAWALSVIQLLASVGEVRTLLARIASSISASGPLSQTHALLLGVAAAVDYVSHGVASHTQRETDTVNGMVGTVVDVWRSLVGCYGDTPGVTSPVNALRALLVAVSLEGKSAPSSMTASCERLADLFAVGAEVEVKHCFGTLKAATVETTLTASLEEARPDVPGAAPRCRLDLHAALVEKAMSHVQPSDWQSVCAGCVVGRGSRAPPERYVGGGGGQTSTAACAPAFSVRVTKRPRIATVHVKQPASTATAPAAPVIPPMHGALFGMEGDRAACATGIDAEYCLAAMVVHATKSGSDSHYVSVVSGRADAHDRRVASAPSRTTSAGCSFGRDSPDCWFAGCAFPEADSIVHIDDDRIVNVSAMTGRHASAWFGTADCAGGAGVGTSSPIAPELLAYVHKLGS